MDLDHDSSVADTLSTSLDRTNLVGQFPLENEMQSGRIVLDHLQGKGLGTEIDHDRDQDRVRADDEVEVERPDRLGGQEQADERKDQDDDLMNDLFGDDDDDDDDDKSPTANTAIDQDQDDDDNNDNDQDDEEERLPSLPPVDQASDDEDAERGLGDFIENDDDDDDDGLTSEERARRRQLEYEEGSQSPPAPIVKTVVTANLPLVNYELPKGGKVWHARLPHFLTLDKEPFDQHQWERPLPDSGNEGENKPVIDENVIRWRWSKDEFGNDIKESNARIVRWSDGSLSLQLGSELFDMTVSLDQSALQKSTTLPVMPSSTTSLSSTNNNTNDQQIHGLTYLVASHDYSELFEAQASVQGTLTFRPTTLQSATHRRLAGSINSRNPKEKRVKVAALPDYDPEKLKQDKERDEVEKQKKKDRDQKKQRSKARGAKRVKGSVRLEGIDFSDEEEEEGDEHDRFGASASRSSGRSQPRRGAGGPLAQRFEDDDEDDDDDGFIQPDDEDEDATGDAVGEDDNGMDVDDEMERAEREMEKERKRRKEERRNEPHQSQRASAAEEPAPAPRRRLVVDDSDEE